MPIHPEEYRLEMFVREAGRGWQCVRGAGGRGGSSVRKGRGMSLGCTHVETDNKKSNLVRVFPLNEAADSFVRECVPVHVQV